LPWRVLRDRPETRFMALVMPRVLARAPWRDQTVRGSGFRYDEYAPDVADRVWMTACYPYAANVVRAVARFGWPADIRGVDTGRAGGGLVTGLAEEPFILSPGFHLPRAPLDLVLRESQERGVDGNEDGGLIAAGFIPLVTLPFGQEPAFCSSRSLHAVPRAARRRADNFADSSVAAQMSAVLCASRFAHTIKMRARDMVGRLRRADDIERELMAWLLPYVNGSISAKAELRARAPLVKARVSVQELAGRDGVFGCVMQLQPYFQLDTLGGEFRFETELGAEAGGASAAA
jgi:type VI secretion system protein ImpD/type VI secretion system protein ImpC